MALIVVQGRRRSGSTMAPKNEDEDIRRRVVVVSRDRLFGGIGKIIRSTVRVDCAPGVFSCKAPTLSCCFSLSPSSGEILSMQRLFQRDQKLEISNDKKRAESN